MGIARKKPQDLRRQKVELNKPGIYVAYFTGAGKRIEITANGRLDMLSAIITAMAAQARANG